MKTVRTLLAVSAGLLLAGCDDSEAGKLRWGSAAPCRVIEVVDPPAPNRECRERAYWNVHRDGYTVIEYTDGYFKGQRAHLTGKWGAVGDTFIRKPVQSGGDQTELR